MNRRVYVEQHRSGMWSVRADYSNGDDVCHYLYADKESADRVALRMSVRDAERSLAETEEKISAFKRLSPAEQDDRDWMLSRLEDTAACWRGVLAGLGVNF